MTVTFGRRDLNRGSVLGLNSPDLTLAIVYDRRTRFTKPCFAARS